MYQVTVVNWAVDEEGSEYPREVATHEFPTFLSAVSAAVYEHGDDAVYDAIQNFEGTYYMVSDTVGYAIHKVEVKEEDVDVTDAAA